MDEQRDDKGQELSFAGTGNTQPQQDALSVLVLEDDPMMRRILEKQLEKVGCRVTTVETGREGP